MNSRPSANGKLVALLMLSLLTASCATKSPTLPVVQDQIRIPSPPVGVTPQPSGTYLTEHCKLIEYASKRLNRKLPAPEHCSQLGPK